MNECTCLLQLLKEYKTAAVSFNVVMCYHFTTKILWHGLFQLFKLQTIAYNHTGEYSCHYILLVAVSKQLWSSISFRTYTIRITIVILTPVSCSVTSSKLSQLLSELLCHLLPGVAGICHRCLCLL